MQDVQSDRHNRTGSISEKHFAPQMAQLELLAGVDGQQRRSATSGSFKTAEQFDVMVVIRRGVGAGGVIWLLERHCRDEACRRGTGDPHARRALGDASDDAVDANSITIHNVCESDMCICDVSRHRAP